MTGERAKRTEETGRGEAGRATLSKRKRKEWTEEDPTGLGV